MASKDSFKRDILWAIGLKALIVLFLVGSLKFLKGTYLPPKESPIFRQVQKG